MAKESRLQRKIKNKAGNSEERERREMLRKREREKGNETLMETDGRPGCWETERRDANMMSSSPC